MAGARLQPNGAGERGLAELLLEFSRAQYRARDGGGGESGGGGGGGGGVERIEKCCLELFSRDYCYSLIHNMNGEICSHYPRLIVFLEYESTDQERHRFESTVQVGKLQDLIHRSKMARCRGRFVCPVILYKGKHICRSATLAGNADSQLFDKVRGHDIKLLRYLSVAYICDLMVENKKVKFGLNVTSSEKVDKAQRYADFTLLSIPYPGCEFFKEYKERDYTAEGLVFNWKQSWDLVQQTQNYLKLLISIINGDAQMTVGSWYTVYPAGTGRRSSSPSCASPCGLHMLVDRLSKGEEIFFFCFDFLKHITSEEFSAAKQLRKSLPPGFTLEEICMLKQRDRGSTTSLSSGFSLVMENSPGAAGSFTYEAVELMPAGSQTQAAWQYCGAGRNSLKTSCLSRECLKQDPLVPPLPTIRIISQDWAAVH
ncbi:hypothetical protein JD844_013275 [Phrynosoma platyrhinos]|uniref:Myotubularin related protein 14 n=1 Tax=Phrynosoma platyrhinos TaxID=52577 RepID=A0ABQ7TMF4_PHRPL|nr:hypothetical protein JD844_013275 [Phrynosoma platyrhinos]